MNGPTAALGAASALPTYIDGLPTDAAIKLIAVHVAAQQAQLDSAARDIGEIKSSLRSGVLLLRLLAAAVPIVAGVGGLVAWSLAHVAIK